MCVPTYAKPGDRGRERDVELAADRDAAGRLAVSATGVARSLRVFMSGTLMALSLGAAGAGSGAVGQGGAALFPYAGFFESDKPILCMLPQGTKVERLDYAPLLDGSRAVILPRYFVQVRVLEGDCEGKVGWLTASHYRE